METAIVVAVVVAVVAGGVIMAHLMKTSKPPPVRRKTILDRDDKNFFLDLAQREPPGVSAHRRAARGPAGMGGPTSDLHDLNKPPE
jgi:hypothetical protein